MLYSEWSQYWPQHDEGDEFGQFINRTPKYVLSSTLTEPSWHNTTVVSGDVAAQVREIKAATERDITMSLKLVNSSTFSTGVVYLTYAPA